MTATLPTTGALVDQIVATLDAVGVRPRAPATLGAAHPDHRRRRSARPAPSATSTGAVAIADRGLRDVAHDAGAGARRPRARLGELLRDHKADLGELVSIEAGKIRSEGLGEVQEMIDICDFAVGLSRQLHGLTIASERPGHRLMETWHPLGPVRRHHGVQLPGRGVVVERGARPRRAATR